MRVDRMKISELSYLKFDDDELNTIARHFSNV